MTSVGRALAVLEAVAASQNPLTVRALASATGLSRSTTHRLAAELCTWGALDQGPEGYRLGLRLFEIGGAAPAQMQLRAQARPFMEDLHEATGRLVQLGVLDGTDVVYLARVGRRGRQPVATEIPGRVPAACSALGKALLAHDRGAASRSLRDGLVARTRYSIVVPEVLLGSLVAARRDGYAVDREETRLGLACIAAPVVVKGRAVAAVSVSGPIGAFEPAGAASAIRATALGIQRALTRP